jgi:hypothetical protein
MTDATITIADIAAIDPNFANRAVIAFLLKIQMQSQSPGSPGDRWVKGVARGTRDANFGSRACSLASKASKFPERVREFLRDRYHTIRPYPCSNR